MMGLTEGTGHLFYDGMPFLRVRSFTGMDRNGHNCRNGLPEWTLCYGVECIKCILSALNELL